MLREPSSYIYFPFLPIHLQELWEEEAGVATGKGRVISGNLFLAACLKDQRWKNEEKGGRSEQFVCCKQPLLFSGCVVVQLKLSHRIVGMIRFRN